MPLKTPAIDSRFKKLEFFQLLTLLKNYLLHRHFWAFYILLQTSINGWIPNSIHEQSFAGFDQIWQN